MELFTESERKKRVRFLENTIPWSAYQEMHYTKVRKIISSTLQPYRHTKFS